jgi:hypothetical protein
MRSQLVRDATGELMVLRPDGLIDRASLIGGNREKSCCIKSAIAECQSRSVVSILSANRLDVGPKQSTAHVGTRTGLGPTGLGNDVDDSTHRPGAVEVRSSAGDDLHSLDSVRDKPPVDPSTEAVVQRHTVQQHECTPGSQTANADELSGRMVVSTAKETRLDGRDVAQEVVDLRAAVKGSAADVILRQDGCGSGDSRRRHWNSGGRHDDFFHDNRVVLVGIGHIREGIPEQKTDHRRHTPTGLSLRGSVHYLARNSG